MESLCLPSQCCFRQSPSVSLIRRNQGLTTGVKLKGGDRGYAILTMKFCRATGADSSQHGVGDGDGLIIVDHGSRRTESNLMLNDFVVMFREKTRYPIVEPAHMELADPSIRDAFASCVQQGAHRIIVSPFFLSPGRHWNQDIPSLAAEAAKEHPGVSYIVTAPLGLHTLLVDIMNDRIDHCLKHVDGEVDECSVCAGTGKCRLYHNHV